MASDPWQIPVMVSGQKIGYFYAGDKNICDGQITLTVANPPPLSQWTILPVWAELFGIGPPYSFSELCAAIGKVPSGATKQGTSIQYTDPNGTTQTAELYQPPGSIDLSSPLHVDWMPYLWIGGGLAAVGVLLWAISE